ncbi:MAG TPA: hypothetical protein VGP31_15820 [Planosporangium sp.]|nr:hypothetical protein [Planosporangium sp.]
MVGAWCFVDHFGPDDVAGRPGLRVPPHPHTGGIAHSEESPAGHPPDMHGLQLWVALPDDARHAPPRFEHHPTVPVLRAGGVTITVVGGLGGAHSPVPVHTPLVGAEVLMTAGARTRLPLQPSFEYAVLVMTGAVSGYAGDPLPAPEMPTTRLKSRDRHGRVAG